MTVRNVKGAGFKLVNVAGEAGRPVVLDRCRVVLAAATEAGVWVEARGTLESKRVVVRNGRFEGPGKAGVRFDGGVADAEVTNNRFWRVDAGVVFGRAPDGHPVRVQVAQNTVYEAGFGLLFAGPGRYDVTVSRNYFARTATVGQAEGGPAAGVMSADNGSDPDAKAGSVHIGGAAYPAAQLPPPNPDDDATFLRFPPGGVLQVGAR